LQEARKLAERPNGRFPIREERNSIQARLSHGTSVRPVLGLLQLDSFVLAHDGDLKGAIRSCLAQLNAARSLGDEPLVMSQLIRIAGVGITCSSIKRVLAQGEPDADDLLQLQRALEEEERFPRLLVALRGERATVHEALEAIESGEMKLADFTRKIPTKKDRRLGFVERDMVRSRHAEILAMQTEAMRLAALPDHQRVQLLVALHSRASAKEFAAMDFAVPSLWVTKFDESARRIGGELRCLITAVAVERYRSQHNEWPDRLQQLVPEYLPAVPPDPHDGEPLGYQRLNDCVVIYSRTPVQGAGLLGVAAYDPTEPSPPGVGLAVHLFDVQHRRQPPRPKPPPDPVPDDPQ
jgi:hypothetical protein